MHLAYDWHDSKGQWWRSPGKESWLFDSEGYMAGRHASINDVQIEEEARFILWPKG